MNENDTMGELGQLEKGIRQLQYLDRLKMTKHLLDVLK